MTPDTARGIFERCTSTSGCRTMPAGFASSPFKLATQDHTSCTRTKAPRPIRGACQCLPKKELRCYLPASIKLKGCKPSDFVGAGFKPAPTKNPFILNDAAHYGVCW